MSKLGTNRRCEEFKFKTNFCVEKKNGPRAVSRNKFLAASKLRPNRNRFLQLNPKPNINIILNRNLTKKIKVQCH